MYAGAAAFAQRAARHAALLVRTDALVEDELLQHLHATQRQTRMRSGADGSGQSRCDEMLFAVGVKDVYVRDIMAADFYNLCHTFV